MKRRRQTLILIITLIASLCTGCGASSSHSTAGSYNSAMNVMSDSSDSISSVVDGFGWDGDYKGSSTAPEAEFYEESAVEEPTINENGSNNKDTEMTLVEEKLVYYCDLEIETKTYSESYNAIKALIAEYNGLIQSESQTDKDYDWYYSSRNSEEASMKSYISCRIPSKNYDEFVNGISNLDTENNKVVSKQTSIDNISQEYYDNKTQIESLEIQEARLLTMMEQAETMEDMIAVEKRLTEVQSQLNRLKTKLVYMDMDVAYSYVNINLEEVKEYTYTPEETTFFSRMWDEVKDAWELGGDLFEGLLSTIFHLIPILIFIILPIVIFIIISIKLIIWIFKKLNKKHNIVDKVKKTFAGDTEALNKMIENQSKQNK